MTKKLFLALIFLATTQAEAMFSRVAIAARKAFPVAVRSVRVTQPARAAHLFAARLTTQKNNLFVKPVFAYAAVRSASTDQNIFSQLGKVKNKSVVKLVKKKNELEVRLVEEAKEIKAIDNQSQFEASFVTGFFDSIFVGWGYIFGSKRMKNQIHKAIDKENAFFTSLKLYNKTLVELFKAAVCHKRGIKVEDLTQRELALITEKADQITTRLRRQALKGGLTQQFISGFLGQAAGDLTREIIIQSAAEAVKQNMSSVKDADSTTFKEGITTDTSEFGGGASETTSEVAGQASEAAGEAASGIFEAIGSFLSGFFD